MNMSASTWTEDGRASLPRYLPVPGAVVVRSGTGSSALVIARPGAWVHAVAGGALRRHRDDLVTIDGDDLRTYSYQPVAAEAATADSNVERIEAGATIGRLPGAYPAPLTTLTLSISDVDGDPVDTVEALLGLPEPAGQPGAVEGSLLGLDPADLPGTGPDDGLGARFRAGVGA